MAKSKTWIQAKIKKLIAEGKTPKAASGQAYSMAGAPKPKKGK